MRVFGDFHCHACGSDYKLEAIHPEIKDDVLISAYFSSSQDFCPHCGEGGTTEYVGAHYEDGEQEA